MLQKCNKKFLFPEDSTGQTDATAGPFGQNQNVTWFYRFMDVRGLIIESSPTALGLDVSYSLFV